MSKELASRPLPSVDGDGDREKDKLVTGGERMVGEPWPIEVPGVGRLYGYSSNSCFKGSMSGVPVTSDEVS